LRHNQPGPGYFHFGLAADEEFFNQLTAEKQQVKTVRGFQVKEWVKKSSDRSEKLDGCVYAYAALQLMLRRYDRKTVWDQLEARLSGTKPELKSRKVASSQASSFISNW
jgi:phage terminase large subunit GpA-like protein